MDKIKTDAILEEKMEQLTVLEGDKEEFIEDMADPKKLKEVADKIEKVKKEIDIIENIESYAKDTGCLDKGFKENLEDYMYMERRKVFPSSTVNTLVEIKKEFEHRPQLSNSDVVSNNRQQFNDKDNTKQNDNDIEIPSSFLDDID